MKVHIVQIDESLHDIAVNIMFLLMKSLKIINTSVMLDIFFQG